MAHSTEDPGREEDGRDPYNNKGQRRRWANLEDETTMRRSRGETEEG